MSAIPLPSGFCPNAFLMRLQTNQRAFASPFGGSEQVIDLMNDHWLISLSLPNRLHADAARVEAFISALRGMTNTVALYHWARKVPRGSMRGAPTVALPIFIGDGGFYADTAQPGATILAGDMVGVSGLLFQAREDAVADGTGRILIPIANRSRKAVPVGTPVLWDRPSAPFRLSSPSAVQYIPGYAPEVSFDFVEAV